MKRLYADDSADSRVKVGNRQAPLKPGTPARKAGVFALARRKCAWRDLSVILWAGHIMRCKSHGYADEEEKTNRSA
uniref:hypothetical protein n=1 Tax=Burkholderia cenocepacia TaxID=95486 RepID=UPI001ABA5951